MRELIDEMLDPGRNWAVVGATVKRDKYGYKVYNKLKSKGYTVYPVNPVYDDIEGEICYNSLKELPLAVDCLSMVVPPEKSLALLESVVETGIKKVWFQPKTYNLAVIDRAKELGLEIVYGHCVLVELKAKYK
jgi:hypothetical protein